MAATKYPLAHVTYGAKEIAAVVEALCSGETTCGKRVKAFEEQFATYVGAKHAAMVNSGSSADLLLAFGLGPPDHRDEILLPAVTWPTQVWSCLMAGYKVRLVDVDVSTLQMDMADLERKINPETRAVFLTHLMGNVGNMDALSWVTMYVDDVLEDCCEALGARWRGRHVGTLGDAGAFSFFFSHHITTMEGGMVVTQRGYADNGYRLLRSHGWQPQPDCRFWFPTWGFNVRPMEVQGAFGLAQLPGLDESLAARRRNAEKLAGWTYRYWPDFLDGMHVLEGAECSWHGFPIIIKEDAPFPRAELTRYLEREGIETRPIVAGNIARQPAADAFRDRLISGELPNADAIHERGFYIGVAPFDDEEGVWHVAKAFSHFLKRQKGDGCAYLYSKATVPDDGAPVRS